jgi:acetyl esterase/lipase
MKRFGMALLLVSAPMAASAQTARPVMTARDLMAIPVRPPDHVLRYGTEPSQFGELRIPKGNGPHAVVVLIHGGAL